MAKKYSHNSEVKKATPKKKMSSSYGKTRNSSYGKTRKTAKKGY